MKLLQQKITCWSDESYSPMVSECKHILCVKVLGPKVMKNLYVTVSWSEIENIMELCACETKILHIQKNSWIYK